MRNALALILLSATACSPAGGAAHPFEKGEALFAEPDAGAVMEVDAGAAPRPMRRARTDAPKRPGS